MEELFGALGLGVIVLIIIAILPYIALIGTWIEVRQMRKELEQANTYLATLNDNLIIGFQNGERDRQNSRV